MKLLGPAIALAVAMLIATPAESDDNPSLGANALGYASVAVDMCRDLVFTAPWIGQIVDDFYAGKYDDDADQTLLWSYLQGMNEAHKLLDSPIQRVIACAAIEAALPTILVRKGRS